MSRGSDRRQLAERIDIRRAETGNHIEVAVVRFDKGKQTGTVNTFTAREDLIQISGIIDNEIQGFDPAVTGGILEVDVTDLITDDEINNVFLGELFGQLADAGRQIVAGVVEFVHFYFILKVVRGVYNLSTRRDHLLPFAAEYRQIPLSAPWPRDPAAEPANRKSPVYRSFHPR